MTKPANDPNKPSPSDTPTKRPEDDGGKAHIREEDKEYHAVEPHKGDIARKHEREEQPVNPGTKPPTEKGMEKGKVQPD
jgi:hypothetical protein